MTNGAPASLDPALLAAVAVAAVCMVVAAAWWRRRGTTRAPDPAIGSPGSPDVDQIMAARAVRSARLRVAPGAAPEGTAPRDKDPR